MKTYVKPVLRYENFQLNQSVATCSVVLNPDGSMKSDSTGLLEPGSYGSDPNICSVNTEDYNYYGQDQTTTVTPTHAS